MADGPSKRYEDLLSGSYDCVDRIVQTRRYESIPKGLKAMAALQDKAIKPLLAAAQEEPKTARHALRHNLHGHAGHFSGAGLGRLIIDNYFFRLRP